MKNREEHIRSLSSEFRRNEKRKQTSHGNVLDLHKESEDPNNLFVRDEIDKIIAIKNEISDIQLNYEKLRRYLLVDVLIFF